MRRARIDLTIDAVVRRTSEGRGLGRGADYLPLFGAREVASHGLSWRIPGVLTGRVHQCLSVLEAAFFYLTEWASDTVDIREQYPLLPVEETIELARTMGIRHPTHPQKRRPIIMTTDFIVTTRGPFGETDVARSVKPWIKLGNGRVREKLALERAFWRARGVEWKIVTERDLPADTIANIQWVMPAYRTEHIDLPPGHVVHLTALLFDRLRHAGNQPLLATCLEADEATGNAYARGLHLRLVRHALARRWWEVDMRVRIDPRTPLIGLRLGPTRVAPSHGPLKRYHL